VTKKYSRDEFDILLDVGKNFKKRQRSIKKVQRAILNRRPTLLDSPERIKAYLKRETLREFQKQIIDKNFAPTSPEALESFDETESAIIEKIEALDVSDDITFERLIGGTNDLLSIETFEKGLDISRSVGLVRMEPFGRGTGFLVGMNIMMTNWHNLPDIATAKTSKFVLDFEENDFGARKQAQEFKLDPDRFYVSDPEHDFALVAVKPKSRLQKSLAEYGEHQLFQEEGKIIVGQPVNIIQHPKGERKKVTVHNSLLVELSNDDIEDQFCYYSADTLKGSSGAPVYNSRWEVIALHRKGVPKTDSQGKIFLKDGRKINRTQMAANEIDIEWVCNQGVRTSRIIQRLKAVEMADINQIKIRDELLEFWGAEDLSV